MAEAWTVDWSLLRVNVPLLALSLALLWTGYAVGGWFWSRTLPEFGESPLPVGLSAAIQLVANLGRYIPGSFAQVLGTALLSRRAGLSPVRATAAAVTVQVVLLLAAFFVGLPAVLGGPAGLGSNRIQWTVSIALATALVAFLWFGGAGALVRWVLRRCGSTEGLPQGSGRRLLVWLPAYAVAWAVQGTAIVLLAQGLGMKIPLATGISAFAAAFFAGYVAVFAPAGFGVREASLAGLLAPVLGAEAGWTLAVVQRAWLTAAEFVAAMAGAVVLWRRGILGPEGRRKPAVAPDRQEQ